MSRTRRAVGIDPGTRSFDICGLEGEHLFLDASIPTAEVSADPRTLVNLLIAEGLAGGLHEKLVEAMRLRDAAGGALDHLFVEGADRLRRRYSYI